MSKKNLVLLCDNYPISTGEFFIDDEMRVIANRFEKVFVVVKSQQKDDLCRYVPENMIVFSVGDSVSFLDKLKALPKILKPFFYEEWRLAVTNYKLKSSLFLFKLMYMDAVRALKLKKQISKILKEEHIDALNSVFYSYWHDYKALSLTLMKESNNSLVCVARAHRWDIYFSAHQFPYLPFKKHIIYNLSASYSISGDGKKEFEELLNQDLKEKVFVSRLGKINMRIPLMESNNTIITFCSCSTLIPVKRVNLIIDLLNMLKITNIKWVHFGDGYMRNELESYAKFKIPNIDYCFKGIVPNSEILDFYRDNYVDLFINLSESEGIPVSIMEALSAGIPVLATEVGGTPEAVTKEVGFLLPKDFGLDEPVDVIQKYLALPVYKQVKYRECAYHFWRENFEAEKNYGEFVSQILTL